MRSSVIPGVFPKIMVTLLMFSSVTVAVGSVFAQEDLTPIPMISGIEMLKVGDTAPDFTVGDISGNIFNMKTTLNSSKGVLIFFWSIFCEPCKAELPIIQKLYETYNTQGIEFMGVSLDGSPMKDAISGFVKQENYSFQALIDELNPDESFKVSDPYGVAGTPTVYIIDSEGKVRFGKVGRASEEELEKVIKQILNL
jgi:peroxiredoxin